MAIFLHQKVRWALLVYTLSFTLQGYGKNTYRRATESQENVKNKIYLKNAKFEASLPAIGFFLNQSYINSVLFQGSLRYFISEQWGFGIDFAYINNSDKIERTCIENFYNDPLDLVPDPCALTDDKESALYEGGDRSLPVRGANFGPAYVDIRELDYLAAFSATWNPIYGKQLAFLSFTSYFDLYLTGGIGVGISTFYPESQYLRNGVLARGPVPEDLDEICPESPGICPSISGYQNFIGAEGRPDAEQHTSPLITIGLGQKFHFYDKFHLKTEIRNYTLLLRENRGGFTYFGASIGLGMRL